jgi:hypothetical protein
VRGNPKINRFIKASGYDWSKFTCVGMMLRGGTKKKPTVVFHVLGEDGRLKPSRSTWSSIDEWEYIDTQPTGNSEPQEEE